VRSSTTGILRFAATPSPRTALTRDNVRTALATAARGHPEEHAKTREENMSSYEGYCVKCREKRQFEGEVVELANGRRASQGTCPTCGTKMNRILGKAS